MIMTVIINYNDNNSNKYIAPEGSIDLGSTGPPNFTLCNFYVIKAVLLIFIDS